MGSADLGTAGPVRSDKANEEWAHAKRVCSANYFNRFFAFALPSGDIFDSEIEAVVNTPWPTNQSSLAALLAGHDAHLVLQKIAEHSAGLSGTRSLDLARAVAAAGAVLPITGGWITDPAFSAGALISRLLRPLPRSERTQAATDVLDLTEPGMAAITVIALEAARTADASATEELLDETALRAVGAHLIDCWRLQPPTALFGNGAGAVQIFGVWARYGDAEEARAHLSTALAASSPLLRFLLAAHIPSAEAGEYLTALDREGYWRLRQMLPATGWITAIAAHFPDADAAVRNATLGSSPVSTSAAAALAVTVPVPVRAFLSAHYSAQTQAPPIPASVFQPTAQRRSQVGDSPRYLLSNDQGARPCVAVRAAVVRPGALQNTGETASSVDEITRRTMLNRMLTAHDPTQALASMLGGAPWSVSPLASWEHRGGTGREVDTFHRGDVNDITTCGYSAKVTVRTGFSASSAQQHIPAIAATIDLQLHLHGDRLITPIELRDLLIDAISAVPLSRQAAIGLLPTGPFDEGELGLWIATNAPQGLQGAIDLGPAGPVATAVTEVEVHSDLERWSTDPGTSTPGTGFKVEATQLAVELIRRCFQQADRQDYAQLLHSLLP